MSQVQSQLQFFDDNMVVHPDANGFLKDDPPMVRFPSIRAWTEILFLGVC